MSVSKKILVGLAILLIFFAGYKTAVWLAKKSTSQVEDQSTVLLERIKTVAKLVTVEGYFSEIYDYKDYWGYDWSPFRKKALLRVKAKVSVGYDLSNMKISTIQSEKKILISELPDPTILSIDHDVDYYDLQEGTFNSFSTEELTTLNARAKDFIAQKAVESELMIAAEEQGNKVFDMIRHIAESAGWSVEFQPRISDENSASHLSE